MKGGRLGPVAALFFGLGLSACAQVWGMETLTGDDGGTIAQGIDQDGAADAQDEGGATSDGSDGATRADAPEPDASDAMESPIPDAQANDAGDASPAVTACLAACPAGCCDATGYCHQTFSATYCGPKGKMCAACMNSCTVTDAPCCTTSGTCGCAVAGFVACQ